MLIGSCPHCSYLNSEGEKNLEWLEICIIYYVFFYTICLLALNIAQRIRTQSIIYYYRTTNRFLCFTVHHRSYNYWYFFLIIISMFFQNLSRKLI